MCLHISMIERPRTIAVDEKTREELRKLKVTERETFDSVIIRLLKTGKKKLSPGKDQSRL